MFGRKVIWYIEFFFQVLDWIVGLTDARKEKVDYISILIIVMLCCGVERLRIALPFLF